ncbi:MAG: cyclophilin-like fold protein [Nitrososphaerota archaeon]
MSSLPTARIAVVVDVERLCTLKGELHRFLAPNTVTYILKKMPIEGYIAKWESAIYILTDINMGAEKTTSSLTTGDIFYWPPTKILGIAFREHAARAQTVRVGKIATGAEILEKASQGVRLRLYPQQTSSL